MEKRDLSLQGTHLHILESSCGWLSCCCSQLLPLSYNTTDSWPWNI
ncbi:unnamed protein product [Staurois parvus]|uniref:Uncharacterized protein n=1 Tax=Staurois parvus TaxID=386267 RepID=A0ABN9BDB5_9NEOB|nr:unnamed protein product [Staurois parvus]